MSAVFLSASIPVAGRMHFETADVMLINSAVRAFVKVVLGRRLIIWGGHPAITPMIWAAAEDLGVSYSQCVHLYQSRFFDDIFPEENSYFKNVTYVDAVKNDKAESLAVMRYQMLHDNEFNAAVFIGGMEGIFEEYELFHKWHPSASVVPIGSPGGAAKELASRFSTNATELTSIDYLGFLYQELGIAPDEERRDSFQA